MSRLGDFIREKREEKRVTLRALAQAAGVSAPFLSDVEHGRRYPSDSLPAIATALGVDELELRKLDDRIPSSIEERLAAMERRIRALEARPYNPLTNMVFR